MAATGNLGNVLLSYMQQGMTPEQARRIALISGVGAAVPSGGAAYPVGATVVTDGGIPKGTPIRWSINSPSDTGGLPVGSITEAADGGQWIVGANGQWQPYTGPEMFNEQYTANQEANKLVDEWYRSGKDPSNVAAAATEAALQAAGTLSAREHNYSPGLDALVAQYRGPDGRISMEYGKANAGAVGGTAGTGGGATGGGAVRGGTGGTGGASGGAASGGTPYQQTLANYDAAQSISGQAAPTGQWSYAPAPEYGGSEYDQKVRDQLALLEGSKFDYDHTTDPVWQAYQKQYRREGERATADTLARAAGMTGGVPSSYAVSAASQAGNYYAAQLADRIPQLYQDAYSRYLQQYQQQLGLLDTYNQLGQQDYSRYRDQLGQYNTDRTFDYSRFLDDVERSERAEERAYSRAWDEDERAYSRAWNEDNRDYNRGQDALDRERQAYLDQYNADQDALTWARQAYLDQQNADADAQDRALTERQYQDKLDQQEFDNALDTVRYLGYVPDWAAQVLGIPAGTSAEALGLGGSGSGGGGSTRGSGSGSGGSGGSSGSSGSGAGSGGGSGTGQTESTGLQYVGTHPNGQRMTAGYRSEFPKLQAEAQAGASREQLLIRIRDLLDNDIISPEEGDILTYELGLRKTSAGSGRNTIGTTNVQMVQ